MGKDKETPDPPSDDKSKSTQKSNNLNPESRPDFTFTTPDGKIEVVEIKNFFSSTGTNIGGTISAIDSFSQSMKDWNRKAITGLEPGLDDYFTKRIEPIKNDLESKLQETKKSLSTMSSFIKDNESSLTNLIAVQGKMSGLESQVSSMLGRLIKLEEDKSINWNKTATIISIIIAVISTAIATYLALVK